MGEREEGETSPGLARSEKLGILWNTKTRKPPNVIHHQAACVTQRTTLFQQDHILRILHHNKATINRIYSELYTSDISASS